jgi:hypothetical protein
VLVAFQALEDSSSSEYKEFNDYIEATLLYADGIRSKRYLHCPTGRLPKSNELRRFMNRWNDRQFRQLTRVTKPTFAIILELICDHPVFSNESNNQQEAVEVQLQVALARLGCNGNGASVGRIATWYGVFTY